MLYGALKDTTNTGLDSELSYIFAAPLAVISNQPAFVSDTLSLKRKTNSQDVQRWELEASIVPTNDSSNFLVHSVKYGHTDSFGVRMPQVFGTRPVTNGLDLRVAATVLAGASLLNINNIDSSLLSGQFISFANHSKVYLIVKDGTGGVGYEIYPPLQQNVTTNTVINYGGKVTMQVRYDLDTRLGITYRDGVLADQGTVRYIEAF